MYKHNGLGIKRAQIHSVGTCIWWSYSDNLPRSQMTHCAILSYYSRLNVCEVNDYDRPTVRQLAVFPLSHH